MNTMERSGASAKVRAVLRASQTASLSVLTKAVESASQTADPSGLTRAAKLVVRLE